MTEIGTQLRLRRDSDGQEFTATVIAPRPPSQPEELLQTDPRWAAKRLGFTTGLETLGSHGCLLTCFTVMLGRSDVGAMNDDLKARNMFVAGSGNVYLDIAAFGAKLVVASPQVAFKSMPDEWMARLYAHMRAGKPAIIGVDYIPWPNDAQYSEHYVLAYGLDDNDRILIADPLPDPARGSNGYLCRRYGPEPAFAACRILLYELTGGNKP